MQAIITATENNTQQQKQKQTTFPITTAQTNIRFADSGRPPSSSLYLLLLLLVPLLLFMFKLPMPLPPRFHEKLSLLGVTGGADLADEAEA